MESSTGLPFLHFLLAGLYLFRGRVSKHVCHLAMLSLHSASLHTLCQTEQSDRMLNTGVLKVIATDLKIIYKSL